MEHSDYAFVCPAVAGPFESANGGGDGVIHVTQRSDRDARAESGRIHAMVCVQDIAEIHGLLFFLRGLFAVDHKEEVGGFAERRIRLHDRLIATESMKVGADYRNLGDE